VGHHDDQPHELITSRWDRNKLRPIKPVLAKVAGVIILTLLLYSIIAYGGKYLAHEKTIGLETGYNITGWLFVCIFIINTSVVARQFYGVNPK
jgi:Na+/melibiose symporter-like transporter